MIKLFLMSFIFGSSIAYADKFLGVEDVMQPAAKDSAVGLDDPSDETVEQTADYSSFTGAVGKPRFAASVAAGGENSFQARAKVGLPYGKYLSLDFSGLYRRSSLGQNTGLWYGPTVDLVAMAPNPSMATPFVGAGAGYRRWTREHNDQRFDDGGSAILRWFGGAEVMLSKHFGIYAVRRQTQVLIDPPISFDDRTTREKPVRLESEVGFNAVF